MSSLIANYNVSNQSSSHSLFNGNYIYGGQSFLLNTGATLDSCQFSLLRIGSPDGNVVAKLFAHSGTYGVDGKPTGAALATSDAIVASTISDAGYNLVTFTFSGANRILLSTAIPYFIEVNYGGGGFLNQLSVGTDTDTMTATGNSASSTDGTTWVNLAEDTPFYVYGDINSPLPTFFQTI